MNEATHPEEFYSEFRKLLRRAAELEIYALPSMFNSHDSHSLRRFDKVDLAVAPRYTSFDLRSFGPRV